MHVNRTSVQSLQLKTTSTRACRQPRRRRARPSIIRWTGDGSAAANRLVQLARFGLAITGKPLLELKPEDA